MPKKNGKVKVFSFNETTLSQLDALCKYYNMRATTLIEFMVMEKYKTKIGK